VAAACCGSSQARSVRAATKREQNQDRLDSAERELARPPVGIVGNGRPRRMLIVFCIMNNIFRKVNLNFRIGRAKITNFLQITKSFVFLMAVFANSETQIAYFESLRHKNWGMRMLVTRMSSSATPRECA